MCMCNASVSVRLLWCPSQIAVSPRNGCGTTIEHRVQVKPCTCLSVQLLGLKQGWVGGLQWSWWVRRYPFLFLNFCVTRCGGTSGQPHNVTRSIIPIAFYQGERWRPIVLALILTNNDCMCLIHTMSSVYAILHRLNHIKYKVLWNSARQVRASRNRHYYFLFWLRPFKITLDMNNASRNLEILGCNSWAIKQYNTLQEIMTNN